MLTVIAIGKIKSGQEKKFENTFSELAELIAGEPGCAGITWGATGNSGEYVLMERYVDEAALEAHRASVHMREFGPVLGDLFEGVPTIVRFTEKRAL